MYYLLHRNPRQGRIAWRVTDTRELTAGDDSVAWLDPRRIVSPPIPFLSTPLTAVNLCHPKWREAIAFFHPEPRKKRVHLLAAGDVGGTLLTALKLLGRDCISVLGVHDLNSRIVARWTAELGQIAWPWDYEALPEVEPVEPERLFDCDVFLFAATKAVPAVSSAVTDVRMAQLAANRPLVESFARQARKTGFRGLFVVLSDPVDQLCRAAWAASNLDETGHWDGLGLLAEQVQGFGLGVMNARAAYFAKQDPRLASFLTEGRIFGPHGKGLVVANSIQHYDDNLSEELTHLTESANLRIRELGFKPYVAPAVSSGAFQLLLTLRGEWHYSSVCLGNIWFGVRNRFTAHGSEIETLKLPDALFRRLQATERELQGLEQEGFPCPKD